MQQNTRIDELLQGRLQQTEHIESGRGIGGSMLERLENRDFSNAKSTKGTMLDPRWCKNFRSRSLTPRAEGGTEQTLILKSIST